MPLYHGSSNYVSYKLEPRKARGRGNEKTDQHNAVYATNNRNATIPFTMKFIPYKNAKNASWSMACNEEGICNIILDQTYIDLSDTGYIYTLDPKGFRQIDSYQWISENPAEIVDTYKLTIDDYIRSIGNFADLDIRNMNIKVEDFEQER